MCETQPRVGLKQYRYAEECLSLASNKKSDFPAEEINEMKELLGRIKGERGPFPEKQPVRIEGNQGWWHFDASVDDDVQNYLVPGRIRPFNYGSNPIRA